MGPPPENDAKRPQVAHGLQMSADTPGLCGCFRLGPGLPAETVRKKTALDLSGLDRAQEKWDTFGLSDPTHSIYIIGLKGHRMQVLDIPRHLVAPIKGAGGYI